LRRYNAADSSAAWCSLYQHYFGFVEAPFSIAPDPRYLYLSQRHQEALAHLLYGISGNGGFVLLTGDVGAGKTTVCRCLLEQIPPSCDVAYIFNPKLTVEELLSTICVEFRIACPPGTPSIKVYVDSINAYLLQAHANGRHTVLIIDEAQNLSADVLEQMRLLTNLETNERKLLQIILIGQPELATMLERPELRQLSQRIVARYRLGPLSKSEVAAYVAHRLEIAGAKRPLFSLRLTSQLYRLTHGIPRVINVLCDRALLGAYVQGKERVDAATLAQAAREVFHQADDRSHVLRALVATLILTAGVAAAFALHRQKANEAGIPSVQGTVKAPAAAESPVAGQAGASVVAAAATAASALPNSLEWPASDGPASSRALAFAVLLGSWGQSFAAGADACKQAEGAGLRCYSARGGLDELRALNRPAVLRMRTAGGEEFSATLTALGDNNASFTLGGKSTTVSLDAVASQWSGHYTLLWRMPPPQVRDIIQLGDRGPAVQWLAGQLALARGQAVAAPNDPVFDEALEREVKKFQLAHGLIPDGSVGPQTMMHLASWGDPAAPKLLSRQSDR
jgi:general secretion pathway protein A